jgi:hypothetical protein
MIRLFIFCTILLIGIQTSSSAQSSVRAVNKYFKEIREGGYPNVPKATLEDSKNELKIIVAANQYTTDTLKKVRLQAFDLIRMVAKKSESQEIRIEATSRLSAGLKDKDSGVIANCIKSLTLYSQQDFSNDSRQAIEDVVKEGYPHIDRLAKLAGFLNLQSTSETLWSIIHSRTQYKNKWACYMALSRMGDAKAITYVNKKLETAPVGDSFVYDIVPDLVYTREPGVFDFLEGIIFSEEQNCNSANPDADGKILCGYRVMEYMAVAIEEFPLPLNKYNELLVKNYETALMDFRGWLTENPDYELKTNNY